MDQHDDNLFEGVTKAALDHGGPYAAQPSGGENEWWYVADRIGFNCIRSIYKPGAIFTSQAKAEQLAMLWSQPAPPEKYVVDEVKHTLKVWPPAPLDLDPNQVIDYKWLLEKYVAHQAYSDVAQVVDYARLKMGGQHMSDIEIALLYKLAGQADFESDRAAYVDSCSVEVVFAADLGTRSSIKPKYMPKGIKP